MSDDASTDTTGLATRARAAVRGSWLSRLGTQTAAVVRDSWLYRWLTAEPEPEVIVIDLRETWTVGPFIRLLDAVLDRVVPALSDSRLAAAARAGGRYTLAAPGVVGGLALLITGLGLGLVSVVSGTLGTTRLGLAVGLVISGVLATRERRRWAELRETRPVELLIAALEPPAPPDDAPPDDAPPEAASTEPRQGRHATAEAVTTEGDGPTITAPDEAMRGESTAEAADGEPENSESATEESPRTDS